VVDEESSTCRMVCLMLSRMAAISSRVEVVGLKRADERRRKAGREEPEVVCLWGWSKDLVEFRNYRGKQEGEGKRGNSVEIERRALLRNATSFVIS